MNDDKLIQPQNNSKYSIVSKEQNYIAVLQCAAQHKVTLNPYTHTERQVVHQHIW